MTTIQIDEKTNDLLKELAFNDASELIKDTLATEILYRISNFSEEVDHFEKKYGEKLDHFKKEYEASGEDFDRYDDLMAWEFAWQGKIYWCERLKEVQHVL
ncbi:MAG: hypothetical protein GY866_34525 [Proteobacteria bacterium]|nr:hypothetical protein [Pseudomonadota bacterium]